MISRIKKFVTDHDLAITYTLGATAGVLVGAWVVYSAMHARGVATLELPNAAVKDLLNGKEVLLDCLEDAHLLVKYIPKA